MLNHRKTATYRHLERAVECVFMWISESFGQPLPNSCFEATGDDENSAVDGEPVNAGDRVQCPRVWRGIAYESERKSRVEIPGVSNAFPKGSFVRSFSGANLSNL